MRAGNILGPVEAFLRIDDTMATGERLRARVVCGVAVVFLGLQAINWVIMFFAYGGISFQHGISVLACLAMIGVALSLRWTRSPWVSGVAYGTALMLGIFMASHHAAHPLLGGGINTSLLPLLVTGPMLLALASDWRLVIAFSTCATALLLVMSGYSAAQLQTALPALAAVGDYDLAGGLAAVQSQALVQACVALWVVTLISAPFGYKLYALFETLEATAATAREAEATKGEFLARMSHEVRTPLNGIIAMSDLLLMQGLVGPARKQAEIVHMASGQLLAIVNDVLDDARLGAGQLDIVADAFDLRAVLDGVVELNRSRADGKGVWLGLEWQEGLPHTVVGDANRWRQVVGNLVGNAVKFTQDGGVRVGVRGVVGEGNGGASVHLQVFVQDTGDGIEADAQARIFERFGQSASGRGQGAGGTGLGLPIARDLVELMGGTLTVRSEPGQGSVFAVEMVLPLVSETVAEIGDGIGAAEARAA